MEKLYYTIGEAAEELKLATHVLRYWESMFPMLKPKKSKNGNRLYREKELELLNAIKHLLYEEGYTIEGARKRLQEEGVEGVPGTIGNGNETNPNHSEVVDSQEQKDQDNTLNNKSKDIHKSGDTPKQKVDQELINSMRQTLREILELLG